MRAFTKMELCELVPAVDFIVEILRGVHGDFILKTIEEFRFVCMVVVGMMSTIILEVPFTD